jgi:flagellar biosynthesis/type III secretory pathway M-ring protein FliF/YscJ
MDGNKFNPEVAEKRKKSRPKYKAQALNQRGRMVAIVIVALIVITILMGAILAIERRNYQLSRSNESLSRENKQIRGLLDKRATVTIEPSVRHENNNHGRNSI